MNRIIHAVLVVINDTGVLLMGDTGSGKSQLALELLRRGHQLVSDDAVQCDDRQGQLYGYNPLHLGQFLDVPVIGIIDVSKIYGDSACCAEHRIDLSIELGKVRPTLPEQLARYKLKHLRLRADAICDLATLLECAVTNLRLQQAGYDASQAFFEQQQHHCRENTE